MAYKGILKMYAFCSFFYFLATSKWATIFYPVFPLGPKQQAINIYLNFPIKVQHPSFLLLTHNGFAIAMGS